MLRYAPSPSFVNSARDLNKQFPSLCISFKLKPSLSNLSLNCLSVSTLAFLGSIPEIFGTCCNSWSFCGCNDAFIALSNYCSSFSLAIFSLSSCCFDAFIALSNYYSSFSLASFSLSSCCFDSSNFCFNN